MTPTKHKHEVGPSGLPRIPISPIGINPITGQMDYNYDLSALDDWAAEAGHTEDNPINVVATGPYSAGLVQLEDGTLYDVTDHHIIVASPAHAAEVHHHIGVQHERSGRYDDPLTGTKWQHTDCSLESCNAPKTEHLKTARERTAVASGKVAS